MVYKKFVNKLIYKLEKVEVDQINICTLESCFVKKSWEGGGGTYGDGGAGL